MRRIQLTSTELAMAMHPMIFSSNTNSLARAKRIWEAAAIPVEVVVVQVTLQGTGTAHIYDFYGITLVGDDRLIRCPVLRENDSADLFRHELFSSNPHLRQET